MQLQNIQISGGITFIPEILTPAGDPYWANVSLLMNTTSTNNQTNNTFLDSSSNNLDVTRNGTVTQGSFAPFTLAPNTSYSTSINGGSGYFNGDVAGNWLGLPGSSTSSALQFGSGDFTIEGWVYTTSTSLQTLLVGQSDLNTGSGSSFVVYIGGVNTTSDVYVGGTGYGVTSPKPTINQWAHVAWVRNGTSFKSYLNGVEVGSTTLPEAASINTGDLTYLPAVGAFRTNIRPFNGYISNLRVVKGTAVYTSAFTPPAALVTAIANTSLLLNFTNAGIFDGTTKNNLRTVGDAKVSTAQAKFAPTSVVFDGNSDALTILNSENFNLGSSDFTIEFWMYMTSFSDGKAILSKGWPTLNAPFLIYQDTVNNVVAFYSSSNGSSWSIADRQTIISAPQINQWYHVAISRSGNTFRLFSNGQLTTTFTSSSSLFNTTQQITIGSGSNTSANNFAGYIQDLRITKGVARYTANFTPPTTAFPTN